MKEKNKKRKHALQKRREVILRRKNLHKDIAAFMVNFWTCNTQDPIAEWKRQMLEGCKGYERMRGRDLVKQFDNLYTELRNPKLNIGFWADRQEDRYNRRVNYGMKDQLPEGPSQQLREHFILESDALMSRLMELAFNLDVEE